MDNKFPSYTMIILDYFPDVLHGCPARSAKVTRMGWIIRKSSAEYFGIFTVPTFGSLFVSCWQNLWQDFPYMEHMGNFLESFYFFGHGQISKSRIIFHRSVIFQDIRVGFLAIVILAMFPSCQQRSVPLQMGCPIPPIESLNNVKRLNLKAYAWQPGARQATTFGPCRGKIRTRISAQGLGWAEAGSMRSVCLAVWAYVELRLCPRWGQVKPMLSHVGRILGPILGQDGPMLSHLGPILAHVGPMLGLCLEGMLGLCWGYVGAAQSGA